MIMLIRMLIFMMTLLYRAHLIGWKKIDGSS